MVTGTPKQLVSPKFLGSSASTLYTVTAPAKYAIVREININNVDTGAHTFTIGVGNPTTTSNRIYDKCTVQPEGAEPLTYSRALVLNVGDSLQGLADVASKVGICVSGVEYT